MRPGARRNKNELEMLNICPYDEKLIVLIPEPVKLTAQILHAVIARRRSRRSNPSFAAFRWNNTNRHGLRPMNSVMPAKAGIHDFTISQHFVEEKSWIPACAGMTVELPRVRPQVSWC